ncbi:ATP-dependent DNA helicase 2 subunit 2 [Cryptococcus neoformans]|nr:ATP-dependent DNA helicase 2 subunit 2 [Cryptococcus neoformans var. grubii]
MSDRAGFTLSIFAIDVSPPMGELKADPSGSGKVSKLSLAKEYVARQIQSKILSGRKTEIIGLVSFGGRTNNQAYNYALEEGMENDLYRAVSSDVACQTAKAKALEVLMNLEVGEHAGNPVSALMVGLDMIQSWKVTKQWSVDLTLITDGETAFEQNEYEEAIDRLDQLQVILRVIGIDFQPISQAVDKSKSRNKRLSEKFWRVFTSTLQGRLEQTSNPRLYPALKVFDDSLKAARSPQVATVNSTLSAIDLHIGSLNVGRDEAIVIPVRYSKATAKASAPTFSKAWKPAMDLQMPMRSAANGISLSNPLVSGLLSQSQSQRKNPPSTEEMAGMISAEVKQHHSYVIKKSEINASGNRISTQASGVEPSEQIDENENEEEDDEEYVDKEDVVKAWKFGSTWVPVPEKTFTTLDTRKGIEVLGFFPVENIRRYHLIGEARYVWPDLLSPKAQIQFSALIEAMHDRKMCAVTRWVLKDGGEPTLGACVPVIENKGADEEGKPSILPYMYWLKLPFAEDERTFRFPSLTTIKTNTGKILTEHPLLPTKEQSLLMDELVLGMDLDEYAREEKRKTQEDEGQDVDQRMDEQGQDVTWFKPWEAVNPVIHRIKEAVFHASLTPDLDKDPLGPPHPELTKYFETPSELAEKVKDVTVRLREVLDIKKVPEKRKRRKAQKEELGEDEGFINEDELFAEPTDTKFITKTEPHTQTPSQPTTSAPIPDQSKPKPGRLISNSSPIDDFNRVIQVGDVFRKAIQDMNEVVKENVESSFSRQNFAAAIDCLKLMRSTALGYEEVETYNDCIDSLEQTVKTKGFKHPDFWDYFKSAGKFVSKISEEEAEAAMEDFD